MRIPSTESWDSTHCVYVHYITIVRICFRKQVKNKTSVSVKYMWTELHLLFLLERSSSVISAFIKVFGDLSKTDMIILQAAKQKWT